jgi:hypothetical protein
MRGYRCRLGEENGVGFLIARSALLERRPTMPS